MDGERGETTNRLITSDKVENYKKEITKQLDILQVMMEAQMHLTDPKEVYTQLTKLSHKWHFITGEDRDFYQGCTFAIEHGIEWK